MSKVKACPTDIRSKLKVAYTRMKSVGLWTRTFESQSAFFGSGTIEFEQHLDALLGQSKAKLVEVQNHEHALNLEAFLSP